MPNGDGGFDFFGGIGELFGSIGRAVQAAIAAIIDFILGVLSVILAILQALIAFLGKAFLAVFKGLRHVISDIVHLRFRHLFGDYLRLKAKLKAFFDPVLRIIRRMRQIYDEWFRRTIVPILNLIHRVRAILAVFRIFHLKFAAKLDAYLSGLEGRILKNTLAIRKKLNEISSLVNLILDPAQLFRENGIFRTLARGWDALAKLAFGGGLRDFLSFGAREGGPAGESGDWKRLFQEARDGIREPNEDQRVILAQISETQADLKEELGL